ncbi:hypothetical protein GCM10009642_41390 [Nocardiopsis metallicus]
MDLPAPEAPSSSTRSPGSRVRSTPRRAWVSRPECFQPQPDSSTRAPLPGLALLPPRAFGAATGQPLADGKGASAPDLASAVVSRRAPTPAMSAALITTITP